MQVLIPHERAISSLGMSYGSILLRCHRTGLNLSGFGWVCLSRHGTVCHFDLLFFLYSDNSADSFEPLGAEVDHVDDDMISGFRHGEFASRGPVCRLSYLLLYSDNLTTRQED